MIGYTKALAKELGPSGITVNCIAPGVIDTKMNGALGAQELKNLAAETPLSRLGTPREVASLVAYLALDRFITGQIIGVDGGFGL
ncbi:MAG: SDR family oxidoreductase [Oscillospiraceae bacterium]